MSFDKLVIQADGGSRGNPGDAGYGAVVIDPVSGQVLVETFGYIGKATNNEAEYRGMIAGLEEAFKLNPQAKVAVEMDSKLVVEQMKGAWKIKVSHLAALAMQAKEIIRGKSVSYSWIPRAENSAADALANEAMDKKSSDTRNLIGAGDESEPRTEPVSATSEAASGEAAPADKPTQGVSLYAVNDANLVSPLTLVLVRHGVTDMTVTHQLSGSGKPGPHLNAAGRVQAAKAADEVYRMGRDGWRRVPKVTRVLASPMTRTQDTGEAIARRLGLKVETEERLREVHFGEWEGLTANEIAAAHGDDIHEWRFGRLAPPGGESIPDVGVRLDGLIRDLAAEHAELARAEGGDKPRAYALASHAVAIKSAVAVSMEMPPHKWGSIWPEPASITVIELRVNADGSIAERHLLAVGSPTWH